MKKFARILCLVLVAVMMCSLLASCGSPAKDPKDAAAALKENGYTLTVDTDSLIVAKKDSDYITINYCTDEEAATKAYDEAKAALDKAEEELKKLEDELKEKQDEYDEMEEGALKDLAKIGLDAAKEAVELAKNAKNYKLGKSGNMVWMGTKQAIKDAK